jgi:perosamine synthetase
VYLIRLTRDDRDAVIRDLERRGIPARAYFSPIHLQPFYRRLLGHRPGDFPVSEAAGTSCLALPFFGTMREAEVDQVCGALVDTLAERAERRAASLAASIAYPLHVPGVVEVAP